MCTFHYIILGETLRLVYLAQESFLHSILTSALIPISSISSSGTHIILRMISKVICVSHLPFCIFLLLLVFGGLINLSFKLLAQFSTVLYFALYYHSPVANVNSTIKF